MKKTTTLLITILLIFSFSVCYAAEMNFTDVKSDDWFYKNLQELTAKNITSGYPDGTFKPSNTLKFEEFIKMLVVATVDELTEQKEGQEWYQIFIDEAIESKYITELQKSLISQNIDRQTMAEILYNVLTEKEDIKAYTDAELQYLSDRLIDVNKTDIKVLTINGTGVISGYPDGKFKPTGTLTRSEAVAVISRVINPELRNSVSMPDTRTLDELPPVDLSHLYDYPTLLGRTVEEDNISNEKWVNGSDIASDYIRYMELTHNRDYETIGNNAAKYKNELLYYLNGYKEYQGKKYSELRAYDIELFKNHERKDIYEYVLSKDDYIEFFLDKWVRDTIDNMVKVQAGFYTSGDLVIQADGIAVRGILRIKYDNHNTPDNIKEELDLVDRDIKVSGQGFLNLSKDKYNIYMDLKSIRDFEVGKWYEIAMDVVVNNTAFAKGLDEKASHSYEYIYPIEIRELE